MHFLNRYDFGGILADDMGLGKTIQVLVLLFLAIQLWQWRIIGASVI